MANNAPLKSLSFDSRLHDENKNKIQGKDIGKSHSFASRATSFRAHSLKKSKTIDEVDDDDEANDQDFTLDQLCKDVHQFLESTKDCDSSQPLEIAGCVVMFLKKVDAKIEEYESKADNTAIFGHSCEEDSSFIGAINRLSSLTTVLGEYKSNHTMPLVNQLSYVLHRVMVFLEDELRLLLEESSCLNSSHSDQPNSKQGGSSKGLKGRRQSLAVASHQDPQSSEEFCVLPDRESEAGEEVIEAITFPYYSPDSVSTIALISNAMITAGYDTECINIFIIVRRHAFEEELKKQGLDNISADDVQKMNWESLEGEISTWIRVFRLCSGELFPGEQKFYESVFSDHHLPTRQALYSDISLAVFSILVNFAEAVSLTKRATEKLFKFLDMYETLRDLIPTIESNTTMFSAEFIQELKSEVSFAKCRLGEAAVAIFCQLENSIKGDNAKTPVASGAIHPLTRYTMNYLKYSCEYKDTLEQVFQQHLKVDQSEEYTSSDTNQIGGGDDGNGGGGRDNEKEKQSPFAAQLITIFDLLDNYLESKSSLYKDLSLRYIFLMNNGRYMLQKVKGSSEIHKVVGNNWCRKRSSDVRHYHKSYQRESWSRVLQCLNQEGLLVNGKIHKPTLKERFKNFNQLFDEIHKSQQSWVVSDEQLQSELRVSISSVMIPAYRSFVARFGQTFTPGRQVEKYIKYQPDDIESAIEELFDGVTNSMGRRSR